MSQTITAGPMMAADLILHAALCLSLLRPTLMLLPWLRTICALLLANVFRVNV